MRTNFATRSEFPNQEGANAGKVALIQRAEWIIAVALSAVVLFLLVVRTTHAAALWRDEAESAQSAAMPIGEMLKNFQYTSFPILFPLSVRAYTMLFGTSDLRLRCFGLAVGLLLSVIAWMPLRRLTRVLPLLLMAMTGLNANFLIAGMSLRGYGLGTFFIVLAFVFTIRFLLNPGVLSLSWVFGAYLASVQCLFFNSALVMALVIAAVAVLLKRHDVKSTLLLTGVASVCALSYIPYLVQFFGGSRRGGILPPILWNKVWERFEIAWGGISKSMSMVWLGVIFLLLVGAAWRLSNIWRSHRTRECELLLFGIILIPLSMITYYAFIRLLPREPEPRYFLALTCLVAATADLLWANLPRPDWLRVTRIGLVLLATIWVPFAVWPKIVQAESNISIVADTVEKNMRPGDLIVVNPWSYGISFNWYYHGTMRWVTVPELEDHRVHRYDLLVTKMVSVSPLADVEAKIATTLKSGNRVWLAGEAQLPAPGEALLQVGPAPDPRFGWQARPYRKAWSQEITLFLWEHAREIDLVDIRADQLVSPLEHLLLVLFEGWKE